MARLGGWHRIGILVSVVWMLGAGVYVYTEGMKDVNDKDKVEAQWAKYKPDGSSRTCEAIAREWLAAKPVRPPIPPANPKSGPRTSRIVPRGSIQLDHHGPWEKYQKSGGDIFDQVQPSTPAPTRPQLVDPFANQLDAQWEEIQNCKVQIAAYQASQERYVLILSACAAFIPVPLGWGFTYLILFLVRWVKRGFV